MHAGNYIISTDDAQVALKRNRENVLLLKNLRGVGHAPLAHPPKTVDESRNYRKRRNSSLTSHGLIITRDI